MKLRVRVRYFAALREALGAEEWVEVLPGSTVAMLRRQLVQRGGVHARLLAPDRAVRCAVDQQLALEDTVLVDGVEAAFFPPVTGG